jgi:hypothetical protein
MRKGLIVSLIIAVVALGVTAAFAFGPGYGMGIVNGTCPLANGTVAPEQSQKFAKFQGDVLPLRQKMLQLRTELIALRNQTPTDWNAISTKQKEMVDVRTEIQKRAADGGFAGAGYGRCGYGNGCGYGYGHGRMGGYGMGRMGRWQ